MRYEVMKYERIRNLRIDRGLTQKQVAERVGITASALCNYEQGTRVPTMQTLRKLAEGYGTSLDYLAGTQ